MAQRLKAHSPNEVSRHQRSVVLFAEVLARVTRELTGLTAGQILDDIKYALFIWETVLAKNKPKKGARR